MTPTPTISSKQDYLNIHYLSTMTDFQVKQLSLIGVGV